MKNSKRTSTGSCSIHRVALLAKLVLCIVLQPAFAEVPLNVLSDCDAIRKIFDSLEKPVSENACRETKGALESMIESRAAEPSDVCFSEQAPSAALRAFSCEFSGSDRGREMTCFRETSLSDIENFTDNFEDHERRQSQYLVEAASCTQPKADVSPAPETLFPGVLQLFSTPKFAFVATWPSVENYEKIVVHGFSKVSRSDSLWQPDAIEYVSAWTAVPNKNERNWKRAIGPWTIVIDDMEEFESAQNDQIRKAISRLSPSLRRQNRLSVDWIQLELQRERGLRVTLQYKKEVTEDILQSIVDELVSEGFVLADTDEIEEMTGSNVDQMIGHAMEKIPPGLRSIASMKPMAPVKILLNEYLVTCSLDRTGAIGAMLMGIEPRPGIESNYGEASLLVLRTGACARGEATDRYVEGLQGQVLEAVLRDLGRAK